MKLANLKITGFRCFSDGRSIDLDDMTTLVGPNASGKTSAMIALARVFSDSPSLRRIVPADFHLMPGKRLKDTSPRMLSIECRLEFPEIDAHQEDYGDAIPEVFNQMVVSGPGVTPYCRFRLDATWTDDGTAAGDIEQSLSWIVTDSDDPEVIEKGNRRKVSSSDRARIRVLYVPASRDPEQQVRGATNSVFGSLMKAISWTGVNDAMKETLSELRKQLSSLKGLKSLNDHVQKAWAGFYRGDAARRVSFEGIDDEPAAFLKMLSASFRPSGEGPAITISELSDGLRSLFSLSLSLGLFAVEQHVRQAAEKAGFQAELAEELPLLTLFAVEEPENHLSPHYLGHVIGELDAIASHDSAQVVVSSHSPSILARVQPDNVRYFLGNEETLDTDVISLPLPNDDSDESYKYVREAIRGFPELYFANLVILCEGPSEEIVLKRIFEANGTPLDTHFISLTPLGGRHVNHFWRLLHGLGINYITLLDLDREKEGAGWGRVQYVRDQLVKLFDVKASALELTVDGVKTHLSDPCYDTLADNDVSDTGRLSQWLDVYQSRFNVFFSQPLDLDFSMLEAFPDLYRGLVIPPKKGPTLPKADSPDYQDAVAARVKQVLADNVSAPRPGLGDTYSTEQQELFPWYKYLFLDGSKPVSHMRAMIVVEDARLLSDMPVSLQCLVQSAKALLQAAPPENGNAKS